MTVLDIVREWYSSGDPAFLAEDIEWSVLPTFPGGGIYRGREAIVNEFFPSVKGRFASYVTKPERFVADGDAVVSTGIYQVESVRGEKAEIRFAHFWRVRDGRISYFEQVADTAAIKVLLDGSAE